MPDVRKISTASTRQLKFILDLQRKHSNALGFLPTAAVEWYVQHGCVQMILENGDPAGYLLGRNALRSARHVHPITQTAICFDAQRRHLGLQLLRAVEDAAYDRGQTIVQAWVRKELEANAFFAAAGYAPVAIRTPDNARQKPLILWRRNVAPIALPDLLRLPRHAGHRAQKIAAARVLDLEERHQLVTKQPI